MSSPRRWSVPLIVIAAVMTALGLSAALLAQSIPPPLMQSGDLVHLGSFAVPRDVHAGGQANAGFEYGGTALAFNPAKNSLFIVGHDWDQFTGEISIPAPGETASLVQSLVDATEGKKNSINPSSPNAKKIGGMLVWDNKLIISIFDYYDGNSTQTVSHIIRPTDLSVKGQVSGPYQVGSMNAGFYSGYMTRVATAWQAGFGGPAMTGNADLAVVGRTSQGPSAHAFNPSALGANAALPLVYYPDSHTTLGRWGQSPPGPYYSAADQLAGVVNPEGTSTVLFFGRHGTTYCYGPGTADSSLAGRPADGGVDTWCYDPTNSSKGTHGYPYVTQAIAYDANDFVAVRQGHKQPWEVMPYAAIPLRDFGMSPVGGAAYDATRGLIYVSQMFADDALPRIHVYRISIGSSSTSTPKTPTNLRIAK